MNLRTDKTYQHFINPDNQPRNKNGTRFTGSNMSSNYWKGFDGLPSNSIKPSQAYSAWLAGKHSNTIHHQR